MNFAAALLGGGTSLLNGASSIANIAYQQQQIGIQNRLLDQNQQQINLAYDQPMLVGQTVASQAQSKLNVMQSLGADPLTIWNSVNGNHGIFYNGITAPFSAATRFSLAAPAMTGAPIGSMVLPTPNFNFAPPSQPKLNQFPDWETSSLNSEDSYISSFSSGSSLSWDSALEF